MTQSSKALIIDDIIAALKTFDHPWLTKTIEITNPTVGIGGDEDRIDLMFNTDLKISESNKIHNIRHHHLTIPKDSCDIPTITTMIMSTIFDGILNVANDIAFGKEGPVDEMVDAPIDQKFIWNRKPEGVSSQWININSTLANACEMFNNRHGGYIDDLVKNPSLRIVRAELSPKKHRMYDGYPLWLVYDCVADGQTHTATKRLYIPLSVFTTPDKLVTTVLVPETDILFPHNICRIGGVWGFDPNDLAPIG